MENTGMYGTRGWTTQLGLKPLLSPFLLNTPDTDPQKITDYEPFAGIGALAAQKLLATLPSRNLKDRQNNAPNCAELLTVAGQHPRELELFGYAIGPDRYDERLTIEGFIYYGQLPTSKTLSEDQLWDALTHTLGLKSHLAPPDEIHYLRPHWNPSRAGWWVWWD